MFNSVQRKDHMRRQHLLMLIIGVLLFAACNNGDDPTSEPSSSNTPDGEAASPTATTDDDSVSTSTLNATNQAELTQTTEADDDTSVGETDSITVWIVDSETPVDYYKCPLLTCDVAGNLPPGIVLNIINTEDDWHEIRLANNEYGFIEVRFTRSEVRQVTPNAPTNLSNPPGIDGSTAVPSGSTTPPADSSPPPNAPTRDPNAPTSTATEAGPPNQPTINSTFETPPPSPRPPQ